VKACSREPRRLSDEEQHHYPEHDRAEHSGGPPNAEAFAAAGPADAGEKAVEQQHGAHGQRAQQARERPADDEQQHRAQDAREIGYDALDDGRGRVSQSVAETAHCVHPQGSKENVRRGPPRRRRELSTAARRKEALICGDFP